MTVTTKMLDNLLEGDQIHCTYHTGIPDRVGGTLTITKQGKSYAKATHHTLGPGYRISKPKRRRDIVVDTANRTGYYIDRGDQQRWAYIEYAWGPA